MAARPPAAYKEVRFQQLRSFCRTAQTGSLKAAAESLGLSSPTVWAQVHALEREFAIKLIEPHGRGSRLTAAGRVLADLAAPLVVGVESLKKIFGERRAAEPVKLTLAAPQRVLVEDLPEAIALFRKKATAVRVVLLERATGQVAPAVASGEADLGLSGSRDAAVADARLVVEPAYHLDPILVAPWNDPLARRRNIRPADLRGRPLVNAPEGFSRPEVAEALAVLGVFDNPLRSVEATSAPVIRRCVEVGLGIGLVLGRLTRGRSRLFEHSMARYFGRAPIVFLRRAGLPPGEPVRALMEAVRAVLER